MPNRILPPLYGAATLVLGLALSAGPAHAGFKWVAPADDAPYASSSAPSAYGVPATDTVTIPQKDFPVVIQNDNALTQPESAAPSMPSSMVMKEEKVKGGTKIDLATATISVSEPSAESSYASPVVQGFATQVPLTLALRQLLPAGYTFAMGPGVDMNTLVSYKSGKPWDVTLREMLAAVGLSAYEQGTVVTINSGNAMPVADQNAQQFLPQSFSQTLPQPSAHSQISVPTNILPHAVEPTSSRNVRAASAPPEIGWTAARGSTLHKVLTEWCLRAGVELKWLAEYDFPIEASASFNGDFENAVRSLLAGFDGARPQPIGALHVNPGASQMVLVVQARGNSDSN